MFLGDLGRNLLWITIPWKINKSLERSVNGRQLKTTAVFLLFLTPNFVATQCAPKSWKSAETISGKTANYIDFKKWSFSIICMASSVIKLSSTTARHIWYDNSFLLPYLFRNIQELENDDEQKRLDIAYQASPRTDGYFKSSYKTFISDECLFVASGVANEKDAMVWELIIHQCPSSSWWIVQAVWHGRLIQKKIL